MTRIPLYDPNRGADIGVIDPSEFYRIHWRDAVEVAEQQLRKFLGLSKDWGIVLFDRATHALEAVFSYLQHSRVDLIMPRNTYRAPYDAALAADGFYIYLEDAPDGFLEPDEDAITVPTPLWGQAPFPQTQVRDQTVVMDCAHVCYPRMFTDLEKLEPSAFWSAVLSFFPTKPCGAFGGGALICPPHCASVVREMTYPTTTRIASFDYPATVQSVGLCRRLEWEQTAEATAYWSQQWELYQQLVDWLRSLLMVPVLRTAPVRPHLLPVRYSRRLAQLCEAAGVTYGRHYPSLPSLEDEPFMTIPFWTPEVLERLQAQAKIQ